MNVDPVLENAEAIRWGKSARIYRQASRNISFYKDSAARLSESIALQNSSIVADVGCGSNGLLTENIFSRFNVRKMYCVDVCPEMISVFEDHKPSDDVVAICGSAEELSTFIPEKLDAIYSNSAIWLFDFDSTLDEFTKVLKPDGAFAFTISEWDLNGNSDDDSVSRRYELIDKELAARGLPPKENHGSKKKFAIHELIDRISEAGFSAEIKSWHTQEMSAMDWKLFYSIPAIAERSLPNLNHETAISILSSAMKNFDALNEPDRLKWCIVSARRE